MGDYKHGIQIAIFLAVAAWGSSFSSCGGCGAGGELAGEADGETGTVTGGGDSEEDGGISLAIDVRVPLDDVGSTISMRTHSISADGDTATELLEESAGTDLDVTCYTAFTQRAVGVPCRTGADGSCRVSGLNEDELLAGLVCEASGPSGTLSSVRIRPLLAADNTVTMPINVRTTIVHGVLQNTCGDDLEDCGSVDSNCAEEALSQFLEGSETLSDEDVGGYKSLAISAQQIAVLNAGNTADHSANFESAIAGNAASLQALAGSEVSGVLLDLILQYFGESVTSLTAAYCGEEAAGGSSVWEALRALDSFDAAAFIEFLKRLDPALLASISPTSIRNCAEVISDIDDGFSLFSGDEVSASLAEFLSQGACDDEEDAGTALGMLVASFPPLNADGTRTFDNFNPTQAAQAAAILRQEWSTLENYIDLSPQSVADKFHDLLRDTDKRRAIISGGREAYGDLLEQFSANPALFSSDDYLGQIKNPTGSSCDSSSDCLSMESCSYSVCASASLVVGQSCANSDDCDSITRCVGAYSGGSGVCMYAAGISSGAPILDISGVLTAGETLELPDTGEEGAICDLSRPCDAGLSCLGCSDSSCTSICVSGDFRRSPFSACSADSECLSENCLDSGICASFTATQVEELQESGDDRDSGGESTVGMKSNGQSCTASSECASFFCQDSVCATPSGELADAVGGGESLLGIGSSCSQSAECESFLCLLGTCREVADDTEDSGEDSGGDSGGPTLLPLGSACGLDNECDSGRCRLAPPRRCI